MKRFLLLLLLAFAMWELQAQIPYFASTAGDGKLYGYTSLKLRSGINTQEAYTTFQYGIGNSVALGTDIYTGVGSNYMGFLARYGVSLSKWFNVGAQFTPSFNLSHNFEFGYLTSALYLNGNISRDGSWFWCANTWWGVNSGSNVKNTIDQWLYVGHTCKLRNGDSLTPMLGILYSWKFNQDADGAAGFYYTHGGYNFYLWGNDFLKDNPRFVVGVDFKF